MQQFMQLFEGGLGYLQSCCCCTCWLCKCHADPCPLILFVAAAVSCR